MSARGPARRCDGCLLAGADMAVQEPACLRTAQTHVSSSEISRWLLDEIAWAQRYVIQVKAEAGPTAMLTCGDAKARELYGKLLDVTGFPEPAFRFFVREPGHQPAL